MKKTLAMVMIFALMVVIFSIPAFALTGQWNAFSYEVKKNGELTITKFDWDAYGDEDVYIPKMIDGYTVTEIGSWAFSDKEKEPSNTSDCYGNEVSVIIPDTVTTINSYAFFCTKISTMNIPSSVKQIGEGAFAGCCNIRKFSVDSNNTRYATIDGVLYGKVEKELISYPSSLSDLNSEITIPEGIISISPYAFYRLGWDIAVYDSINLPSTLEKIGHHAFYKTSVSCIHPTDSIHDDYGTYVVIPESVKDVGESAFELADDAVLSEGYEYIDISHSKLTVLPKRVFANACNGYSVELPSSLERIEEEAFAHYEPSSFLSLTIFDNASNLISIGNKAFYNIAFEHDTLNLPSSLTSIGDQAFYCDYESMRVLNIPSSVTEIGDNICNRENVDIQAEDGSYAYFWASQNGYTMSRDNESTDWLTSDGEDGETEDTSWLGN